MKILTTSQIRQADARTVELEPVTPLKLMERAAESCAKWLIDNIPESAELQIFCGKGNNGGDGLALARLLHHEGFRINVFSDPDAINATEGFQINFQRLTEHPHIKTYGFADAHHFSFSQDSIFIDALFGAGLRGGIEGVCAELIQYLNGLPFRKIAIDIPSGLLADTMNSETATIFQVHDTLSFQFWKKAFLHPETGVHCGKIHILDIGLNSESVLEQTSEQMVTDDDLIESLYRPRAAFSHKGNFGNAHIVAGSFGKMGAAVLATKASARAGAGITFVSAPWCGYEILQSICPEAMFAENGATHATAFMADKDRWVGIGPGLGNHAETQRAFLEFLKSCEQPLVLDADALNIIAQSAENLPLIPKNSILTPHPKEFERLFGRTANSFERLDLAVKKSRQYGIYIVLKDRYTQIITPDGKIYYNITGNAGMAKGGSGDVLLGVITALLAQHYLPEQAAVFGVWLHGKAGDFAAEKYSQEAMLPSDLIGELGNVFLLLAERRLLAKNL